MLQPQPKMQRKILKVRRVTARVPKQTNRLENSLMETTWCTSCLKKARNLSLQMAKTGKLSLEDHLRNCINGNILTLTPCVSCCRTVNFIIEIEVDGQKQYSTPKDDVTTNDDSPIMLEEHIFFELKNLVSF